MCFAAVFPSLYLTPFCFHKIWQHMTCDKYMIVPRIQKLNQNENYKNEVHFKNTRAIPGVVGSAKWSQGNWQEAHVHTARGFTSCCRVVFETSAITELLNVKPRKQKSAPERIQCLRGAWATFTSTASHNRLLLFPYNFSSALWYLAGVLPAATHRMLRFPVQNRRAAASAD